jgi:UDP-N-acetyl-D-mannosaminuronic acid transferase (WecB/TagA/CpsF family)
MALAAPLPECPAEYRKILGVDFFVGGPRQAADVVAAGGLVVAPAGPALLDLRRDEGYRAALLAADVVLTDSACMVLVWNVLMRDRIRRVSGLEYLKVFLSRADIREPGATFWIMPSVVARDRNLAWLQAQGLPIAQEDCYVAPKYRPSSVCDLELVARINDARPRHVIICLGGGVQEKLGHYLRDECSCSPAFHCIGAAIGFLTGDQVRIPDWADRSGLGWLFRCISDPRRFVPRYTRAALLPLLLFRYRSSMPTHTAGMCRRS